MAPTDPARPWVHRTASIRLRVTRRQADRCHGLLRSGGDVWAWRIDTNRLRQHQSRPPVVSYQALCKSSPAGTASESCPLSVPGRYCGAFLRLVSRGQASETRGRWHPGAARRRARHLIHVRGLPASGPQTKHPTVSLPALQLPSAPGSRGCSQHRRQSKRRRKQRSTACAHRAPSSRHGVTVAVICTTNGDEDPAWPRATCIRPAELAGVARRTQHFLCKRRGSSSVAHQGIRSLKGH